MEILSGAGRFVSEDGKPTFVEHLRVQALSVGTYCIPDGAPDDQTPHREDEIYVVTSGSAVIEAGGRREPVTAGAVIYVPKHEAHTFHEVTGDFTTLVLFAPPYTEPPEA